MTKEEAQKIALRFAVNQNCGYDSVRYAGEKGGSKYFHYFREDDLRHRRKLGLPHIVKIDNDGNLVQIWDFKEIMWARRQEIEINHLG